MEFNRNENKPVVALLGAGAMGMAIVKRIAANKTVLLGDISVEGLQVKRDELCRQGYSVETFLVDAGDKASVEAFAAKAASLGEVRYYIHTAGASPNQTTPENIVRLDLIATSFAIDAFGKVIAKGGAGLVISSQTGYMMHFAPETEHLLATTPTDKLGELEFVCKEAVRNPGIAYIAAKRTNQLRVRTAAATTWAEARARINTISPGIIVTPLAYDEFAAAGEGYQRMIDASAARRTGTVDEIANAAEFLLSDRATFITGIDLLIDGGVIAAIETGKYAIEMK